MNIYIRSQDYDLFKYLTDEQTKTLISRAEIITIATAQNIIAVGDNPSAIYIVRDGQLKLTSSAGVTINTIHQGEIVGEVFLYSTEVSPFSVSSTKPSVVIKVPYDVINEFMNESAENASRIQAAINDTLCQKTIRITHYKDHNE